MEINETRSDIHHVKDLNLTLVVIPEDSPLWVQAKTFGQLIQRSEDAEFYAYQGKTYTAKPATFVRDLAETLKRGHREGM